MEIWQSLKDRRGIELYGASSVDSSHGPYVFSRHFTLPDVRSSGWIDELNELVRREHIDYVFPAHDDVVRALAERRHEVGAGVVSSPPETCIITRSKLRTYRVLGDVVPVPRVYDNPECVPEYPVVIKPDIGQGSQGVAIAKSEVELRCLLSRLPGLIITEYLPGDEYTVDCFSDRERGLLFCRGRQRVRVKAGISVNSRAVDDQSFYHFAQAISQRLVFYGAWFFQVKRDREGRLRLLEVAPRIAGTMALHRVQGVNFPLLSLLEQERVSLEILPYDFPVEIDRALVNRYRHNLAYGTVYVDLDDTLVIDGQVNTMVIRFIYQCLNRQIPLVLLTKHEGDLEGYLKRHRLAGLFDRVVKVPSGESKASYIKESDAILIDDSFQERRDCATRGIMAFDTSMLEVLLDDRR
jgi:hypothetical protein